MVDPETPDSAPTATQDDTPPAVPWIQALGLVAVVAVIAIDAWGPPEFEVPREVYLLCGAAIIGLGPEQFIRLIAAWRK